MYPQQTRNVRWQETVICGGVVVAPLWSRGVGLLPSWNRDVGIAYPGDHEHETRGGRKQLSVEVCYGPP